MVNSMEQVPCLVKKLGSLTMKESGQMVWKMVMGTTSMDLISITMEIGKITKRVAMDSMLLVKGLIMDSGLETDLGVGET